MGSYSENRSDKFSFLDAVKNFKLKTETMFTYKGKKKKLQRKIKANSEGEFENSPLRISNTFENKNVQR